ncbi:DNA topoisomerase IV subunit B, partial [Bacillus thuringiensis]|nr:DNA topoisomerase IV subunit B [Bacillus thuringiensis]
TKTFNEAMRAGRVLKAGDADVVKDDVLEGLTSVVTVRLAEPQFEGQTKTKLGNAEAKSFVQKALNEKLSDWFEENPNEGKSIVRKSQAAAQARV